MIKVGTVFTGIGAFEYALKKMKIPYSISFACDCGDRKIELDDTKIKEFNSLPSKERRTAVENFYNSCKKENRVKDTYFKNYKIKDENWYSDIRFLDGTPFKNKIDIFVGGSPCQSFSLMGKRRGLEDTRGTLFYEFARLVNEIKPRVFIYENVPGMLVHDGGKTWETIQNIFNSLGYKISWDVLNSCDYGIPQSRKRLFVVGFRDATTKDFKFPKKINLNKVASDFYEDNIDEKFYLKEKGFKFVTSKKNRGRAKINSTVIRTQKRNQQFNWNGDFVFVKKDEVPNHILKTAYLGQYNGEIGVARKLTPRECHRLMGFGDDFIINEHVVDAYKQAGNSIVVDVLERIIKQILKVLE